MRRLGVRSGDDLRLAFTRIGNDYWTVFIDECGKRG